MFEIDCPHCHKRSLRWTSSIIDFKKTDAGPLAQVRCPHGHELIRNFRTGATIAIDKA